MIVFDGNYVLKECLEQVYPYATQILIAEGPVKHFQELGRTTSNDGTNDIIDNFPDPENKIKIVHGQFSEKDEQVNAYMKFLRTDIDYLFNLDSDEVWKGKDIEKLCEVLSKEKYTSVGVRSASFFGGFDYCIGGFELATDNFLRVFRVVPGCRWLTHRPPTIMHPNNIQKKHLNSDTLWSKYGIQMYHYSYVFPEQVKNKIEYYAAKVSRSNCRPNYFHMIYLPWVLNPASRQIIEDLNDGVHEFISRPSARTYKFEGEHPEAIKRNMNFLLDKLERQADYYK